MREKRIEGRNELLLIFLPLMIKFLEAFDGLFMGEHFNLSIMNPRLRAEANEAQCWLRFWWFWLNMRSFKTAEKNKKIDKNVQKIKKFTVFKEFLSLWFFPLVLLSFYYLKRLKNAGKKYIKFWFFFMNNSSKLFKHPKRSWWNIESPSPILF